MLKDLRDFLFSVGFGAFLEINAAFFTHFRSSLLLVCFVNPHGVHRGRFEVRWNGRIDKGLDDQKQRSTENDQQQSTHQDERNGVCRCAPPISKIASLGPHSNFSLHAGQEMTPRTWRILESSSEQITHRVIRGGKHGIF